LPLVRKHMDVNEYETKIQNLHLDTNSRTWTALLLLCCEMQSFIILDIEKMNLFLFLKKTKDWATRTALKPRGLYNYYQMSSDDFTQHCAE